MNDAKINWYSINLKQKVEAHEPVDLPRALEIANRYLAHRLLKRFASWTAAVLRRFSPERICPRPRHPITRIYRP
jgi:hypothetical protein